MSDPKAAQEALLNYTQADMDGIMVLTSRQAIHEVCDEVDRLRAVNAAMVAFIEKVPARIMHINEAFEMQKTGMQRAMFQEWLTGFKHEADAMIAARGDVER